MELTGRSLEPLVDQMQQLASLGTGAAHNGTLRTGVDEGLQWMAIDLGVDVQHEDPAHALGILLHHLVILIVHILLPLLLTKILLGLHVVGAGLETTSHVALLGLGLGGPHGSRDSPADGLLTPQLDPGLPRTGRSELGGQSGAVIIQFLDEVGMVGTDLLIGGWRKIYMHEYVYAKCENAQCMYMYVVS